MVSKNFITKIGVLLQCDPKYCSNQCILYDNERARCTAPDFLIVFNAVIGAKFSQTEENDINAKES